MLDLNAESRQHVGVIDSGLFILSPDLRKHILLFDRLAVLGLNYCLSNMLPLLKRVCGSKYVSDVELLASEGILFEPSLQDVNKVLQTHPEMDNLKDSFINSVCISCQSAKNCVTSASCDYKAFETVLSHALLSGDFESRAVSILMRERDAIDTSPVLSNLEQAPKLRSCGLTEVVRIVFNMLPVLSVETPIEEVIQFRNDSDTRYKLHHLRRWMHNLASKNIVMRDIENELQWLLHDYQRHMEINRLKADMGTLETIVIATAEIAEGFVKFKWGKVAKMLFSAKRQQVELLEKEIRTPGAEVAYIAKVRDSFVENE